MRVSVRALLSVCAAVAMAWSCSKSTEPSTNSITVTPSTSVTLHALNDNLQLSATLFDKNGSPVSGTTFSWSSSNTAVATVGASTGLVTSKTNGTTTITVSGGGTSKPITVTVAQTAATAIKLGDNQLGNQGAALGQNIVVVLNDSTGNPVVGATVTFAVATGGGSVNPTSMVSDGSGNARTSWTLGSASSVQTATATFSGLSPVIFTGNSIPATAPGFQIVIINVGPAFSPAVQTAFDSAVAFWQRAITGDLQDFQVTFPANGCGNPSSFGPVTDDDVIIIAKFDAIDGPGKILGQAGSCGYRPNTTLSLAGGMIFDTADVAGLINSGTLNQVIRHEMGHVLGFGGTAWTDPSHNGGAGCLVNPVTIGNAANPPDTHFVCPKALAYFDSIGGTAYTLGAKVPVENCGAGSLSPCLSGTYNSHWREQYTNVGAPFQGTALLGNELMTGFLNGGSNPASKLTIAAMEDLGYTVNYAAAEPYTQIFHAPSLVQALQALGPPISLGNDILHFPQGPGRTIVATPLASRP